MYQIDLNSDMEESFGAYEIVGEEQVIQYVTSTNVACGFHAGDPMVMQRRSKWLKETTSLSAPILAIPIYMALAGEKWYYLLWRSKMTSSIKLVLYGHSYMQKA